MVDDLLKCHVGGVDGDGVLWAFEGAVGAVHVLLVAGYNLLEDEFFVGFVAVLAELVGAALGANGGIGVEVEFDGGVGEDDGALVAAFCDEAGMEFADETLGLNEGLADGGDGGDLGGQCGDIGVADAFGGVLVVDEQAGWGLVPVEVNGDGLGGDGDGFVVGGVDVLVDDGGGDGAVHGAGV